jgi:hypothetical protein
MPIAIPTAHMTPMIVSESFFICKPLFQISIQFINFVNELSVVDLVIGSMGPINFLQGV